MRRGCLRAGDECRLPTEQEWEKAARSSERALEYPWWDEFDKRMCTTWESELQRTTPVCQDQNLNFILQIFHPFHD